MKVAIGILYVLWAISIIILSLFTYLHHSTLAGIGSDYDDLVSGKFTGRIGEPVGEYLKVEGRP